MTGFRSVLGRAALVAFIGLVALPALVLSAADVIDELKLDRQDATDSVFDSIFGGHYAYGVPLAAFRALPPARQVEVVNGLGSFIRGYVESAAFKARYAEAWKAHQPRPPQPARPGAEMVAEQLKQIDSQIAESEANLKKAPADQREMYQSMIAGLKQAREAMAGQESMYDMAEKMRFEGETREYQEKLEGPNALPEDPGRLVARRLQEFLDLTASVDFNAKLTTGPGMKRFVDRTFESKPTEWKMCFRAGKPAVDAARAFAGSWLKQIKVGP